jgi:hypothetical protein
VGPVAPAPLGPVAPVGPVLPVLPLEPAAPTGPVGPPGPVGPLTPVGPASAYKIGSDESVLGPFISTFCLLAVFTFLVCGCGTTGSFNCASSETGGIFLGISARRGLLGSTRTNGIFPISFLAIFIIYILSCILLKR